jgi:hypothetical protein
MPRGGVSSTPLSNTYCYLVLLDKNTPVEPRHIVVALEAAACLSYSTDDPGVWELCTFGAGRSRYSTIDLAAAALADAGGWIALRDERAPINEPRWMELWVLPEERRLGPWHMCSFRMGDEELARDHERLFISLCTLLSPPYGFAREEYATEEAGHYSSSETQAKEVENRTPPGALYWLNYFRSDYYEAAAVASRLSCVPHKLVQIESGTLVYLADTPPGRPAVLGSDGSYRSWPPASP